MKEKSALILCLQVKMYAASEDRWLLVNVQEMTEFKCHILNRDVWSNSGVKALIESNFTFYQVSKFYRKFES